jgi:hypothetical protein
LPEYEIGSERQRIVSNVVSKLIIKKDSDALILDAASKQLNQKELSELFKNFLARSSKEKGQ